MKVEKIAADVSRHALRSIRKNNGVEVALAAFHAYFKSKLKYGINFWTRSLKQKKSWRIKFYMKPIENCENLSNEHFNA